MILSYLEHARQVKAEADIAFKESVCGAGKEGFFIHTGAVAEM